MARFWQSRAAIKAMVISQTLAFVPLPPAPPVPDGIQYVQSNQPVLRGPQRRPHLLPPLSWSPDAPQVGGIGGGGSMSWRGRLLQYQQLGEPVFVPPTVPAPDIPTGLVDTPVRRRHGIAHLTPALSAPDPFVPLPGAEHFQFPDHGRPVSSKRVPAAFLPPLAWNTDTPGAVPPVPDLAYPQAPEPLPRPGGIAWTLPATSYDPTPVPVPPVSSWGFQGGQPAVRRHPASHPAFFFVEAPAAPSAPEIVHVSQPIQFRAKSYQHLGQSFFYGAPPIVPPTAPPMDSWYRPNEQIPLRTTRFGYLLAGAGPPVNFFTPNPPVVTPEPPLYAHRGIESAAYAHRPVPASPQPETQYVIILGVPVPIEQEILPAYVHRDPGAVSYAHRPEPAPPPPEQEYVIILGVPVPIEPGEPPPAYVHRDPGAVSYAHRVVTNPEQGA